MYVLMGAIKTIFGSSWTTFAHAHLDSLVGCDYLTKHVYMLRGILTAYMRVFIHIGSRRVYCSRPTCYRAWSRVMQQAPSAHMRLEVMGVKPRFSDSRHKIPAPVHTSKGRYIG